MLTITTLYRNMALLSPRSYNKAHGIGGGFSQQRFFFKFTPKKWILKELATLPFWGKHVKNCNLNKQINLPVEVTLKVLCYYDFG